VLRYSF